MYNESITYHYQHLTILNHFTNGCRSLFSVFLEKENPTSPMKYIMNNFILINNYDLHVGQRLIHPLQHDNKFVMILPSMNKFNSIN